MRDSAAAPIEFMGFVATLLLGLVVVIVVVGAVPSLCGLLLARALRCGANSQQTT